MTCNKVNHSLDPTKIFGVKIQPSKKRSAFSPCFGKGFKGQNHEEASAIEKGNMEIDDDLTSDD